MQIEFFLFFFVGDFYDFNSNSQSSLICYEWIFWLVVDLWRHTKNRSWIFFIKLREAAWCRCEYQKESIPNTFQSFNHPVAMTSSQGYDLDVIKFPTKTWRSSSRLTKCINNNQVKYKCKLNQTHTFPKNHALNLSTMSNQGTVLSAVAGVFETNDAAWCGHSQVAREDLNNKSVTGNGTTRTTANYS